MPDKPIEYPASHPFPWAFCANDRLSEIVHDTPYPYISHQQTAHTEDLDTCPAYLVCLPDNICSLSFEDKNPDLPYWFLLQIVPATPEFSSHVGQGFCAPFYATSVLPLYPHSQTNELPKVICHVFAESDIVHLWLPIPVNRFPYPILNNNLVP